MRPMSFTTACSAVEGGKEMGGGILAMMTVVLAGAVAAAALALAVAVIKRRGSKYKNLEKNELKR